MKTIKASCKGNDINGNRVQTFIYVPIIHVLTFSKSVENKLSIVFDPIWLEKMKTLEFDDISTSADLEQLDVLNSR